MFYFQLFSGVAPSGVPGDHVVLRIKPGLAQARQAPYTLILTLIPLLVTFYKHTVSEVYKHASL